MEMEIAARRLTPGECLSRANECRALAGSSRMVEHSVALRLLGDMWERIAQDIREADSQLSGTEQT